MVDQLNSVTGGMLRASNAGLPKSEKLAVDTKSLDQLRAQAKQSPDKALKAASQQFEAVFMNMMLKSMREATPQDGMFDSEQTKMFTGMLDQQFAQGMSSKGIGLADILYKQLSSNHGGLAPVPHITDKTSTNVKDPSPTSSNKR